MLELNISVESLRLFGVLAARTIRYGDHSMRYQRVNLHADEVPDDEEGSHGEDDDGFGQPDENSGQVLQVVGDPSRPRLSLFPEQRLPDAGHVRFECLLKDKTIIS